MEVYTNTAQEADWDGAWAVMARTNEEAAEEARIEAERSERQSFEKGLEDWLDAQAKSAAEEAAAEEEAAAAAEARRRATYRSKRDGLTQVERAQLRDPSNFHVEEVGPDRWWAAVPEVEAVFSVRKMDTHGSAEVVSNTGSTYTVNVLTGSCPCPWHEQHPEEPCKHLAPALAVMEFRRTEREAVVQAKYERNRRRLDGVIARRLAGGRLAA